MASHRLGQTRRLGEQAGVAHRNRRRHPKITQRGRAPKATLDRRTRSSSLGETLARGCGAPEPTPPRDTTIRSTPVEQPALPPRRSCSLSCPPPPPVEARPGPLGGRVKPSLQRRRPSTVRRRVHYVPQMVMVYRATVRPALRCRDGCRVGVEDGARQVQDGVVEAIVGKHGLFGQCVVAGNAVTGNAVATAGQMAASTVMAGSRVLPSSASRSAAVRRCRVPLFTGRNDGSDIGINLLVPTGYSGGRGSLSSLGDPPRNPLGRTRCRPAGGRPRRTLPSSTECGGLPPSSWR